eukprot:TRINITY_DN8958_c0_g1_i1.p1 TRINITY_DN8958_c0_g1~~TRINITY_DN8958_c0_g1_i1.p1  ORF type:complete len:616 (+),score=128.94 TRINITY_DN8958_c0_g1_i1:103-1950(+)
MEPVDLRITTPFSPPRRRVKEESASESMDERPFEVHELETNHLHHLDKDETSPPSSSLPALLSPHGSNVNSPFWTLKKKSKRAAADEPFVQPKQSGSQQATTPLSFDSLAFSHDPTKSESKQGTSEKRFQHSLNKKTPLFFRSGMKQEETQHQSGSTFSPFAPVRMRRSTSLTGLDKLAAPSEAVPYNQLTYLAYIKEEIIGSYEAPEETDKREEVYNFIQVPFYLETMILYGVLLCFDVFLFLFTFLPIRVIRAAIMLVLSLFSSRWKLSKDQYWDLLRALIMTITTVALLYIDTSRLYHYIRGQAILKLYVIFNVLEIFDKLCCSIGLDIFDALFWKTMEHKKSQPTLAKLHLHPATIFTFALAYTFVHAVVLFFILVSLNVAINSHNNALLTLLVSNQFVELKGAVFKKFERENLFQISCSDVVERFYMVLFLTAITMQNFSDLEWNLSLYWVNHMVFSVVMVWLSECAVDWIKHAFITKFNHIPPDVYDQFKTRLTSDIVPTYRNKRAFHDTQITSKKIGLVPFPIACVAIRTFIQLLDRLPEHITSLWLPYKIALGFGCFLVLCLLKTWLRVRLVARSLVHHRRKSFDKTLTQSDDMPDRFTMFKGKMAP